MLSNATLHDICATFSRNPLVLENGSQLFSNLGLDWSDVDRLRAGYISEQCTSYGYVRKGLSLWVSMNEEAATISRLTESLFGMGFVELGEQIQQLDADTLDRADKDIPLVCSLSIPQRVIRALGAGAFGIVFEIEKGGTHLAQKIMIEPTNTLDEKEVATILRECELFVGKEHVNIVKVLDYQVARDILNPIENLMEVYRHEMEHQTSLEQDDISDKMNTLIGRINRRSCTYFSINMELCGSTLRQWFTENENTTSLLPFRPQIAEGIISGLKYLHGENIIHRDLKPENIYFAKDPFQLPVKIGDFGHCRELQDRQSAKLTTDRCTQEYRAPEIHKGEKYSFRADLYSLGLILFEVLQIIKSGELRRQFAKLKDDEYDVIIDNSEFPNLKESIINLTRKKTKDRVQSIYDVIIINVNDKVSV